MLRFTTIILSLTFLAQWSEANEDVKVDELEYLLITASRINERAFEAPYHLHSVEETNLFSAQFAQSQKFSHISLGLSSRKRPTVKARPTFAASQLTTTFF